MSSRSLSSDSGVWSIDASTPVAPLKERGEVKRETPAVQFDTVVAGGCQLRGNFFFQGKSHVEGMLEGDVAAEGELYIGEAGQIKATIRGERVFIFGRVIGDILCSERLELFSGARVSGNIVSPRLVIHDGVIFDGYCRMEERQPEAGQGEQDTVQGFESLPGR